MPVRVPLTTSPAQGLSFWVIASPQGTSLMVQVGTLSRDGFKSRTRAMRRLVLRLPDLQDAPLDQVFEAAILTLQEALHGLQQGQDTPA